MSLLNKKIQEKNEELLKSIGTVELGYKIGYLQAVQDINNETIRLDRRQVRQK